MRVKVLCLCGNSADRSVVAALTGLYAAGVDLTVALPLGAQARRPLAAAGIRLLDDSLSRSADTRSVRRLRREIAGYGYQIVHVLTDSALRNTILAIRDLDVKLVARCRSIGSINPFRPSSWPEMLSSRVNGVVCETDAIRRQLEGSDRSWWRSRNRLPVTIYKGFDPKWYTAAGADLSVLGVPDEAFVVSCLGADIPPRGSMSFCRILEMLAGLDNLHILLIGADGHPASFELPPSSPMSGRVHLIDTSEDALAHIAASDIFVMPFASSDILSESLLGAMACGVPVVAARSGWSSEFVADGESGIVVQAENERMIADAIRTLYGDAALCDRYASAAQESVRRNFTVERAVAGTFRLYQQLLMPGW